MTFCSELIDELLQDYQCPAGLIDRRMTTRDIQDQVQGWYGVIASYTPVSTVSQAVKAWQNRSLKVYPIAYIDAIVVKVRQDGRVINEVIHWHKLLCKLETL